jgi:non-ribosomal peptide synthetase component F
VPLHLSLSPGTTDRPESAGTGCIPHLFQRQAAQTPDAVAVVCKDERVTYRELRQRAVGLARRLTEAGCGSGCLVGLCVERSLDLIVAILGILEAGGAYVPLDPAYPRERLALILEESRVPLLVAQSHRVPRLPAVQARVLLVDGQGPLPPLSPVLGGEGSGAHKGKV